MKKVILFFVMIVSALFLLIDVARAWNGLAFSDIYERLGAFVIFAVSFLLFPKSKNFNEKMIFGVLILEGAVLIAPSIIFKFIPEQDYLKTASKTTPSDYFEVQPQRNQTFPTQKSMGYSPQTEYDNNPIPTQRPQVQCSICKGSGTVRCTSCNGTGETYKYKSITRYTPLQPGESSMMKIPYTCIVCKGTGEKMCLYCAGKGYK